MRSYKRIMGIGWPGWPLQCRYIVAGKDKGCSRNSDNTLVWTAAHGGREAPAGGVGDICTDDRKIAGVEFKDVRTSTSTGGLLSICMRVGANSSEYSHNFIEIGFN